MIIVFVSRGRYGNEWKAKKNNFGAIRAFNELHWFMFDSIERFVVRGVSALLYLSLELISLSGSLFAFGVSAPARASPGPDERMQQTIDIELFAFRFSRPDWNPHREHVSLVKPIEITKIFPMIKFRSIFREKRNTRPKELNTNFFPFAAFFLLLLFPLCSILFRRSTCSSIAFATNAESPACGSVLSLKSK